MIKRMMAGIALLMVWTGLQASQQEFPIAVDGKTANIMVDGEDWTGVIRAARDLGDDVRKVTGTASEVVLASRAAKGSIIVGTIGRSRLIDRLVAKRKLDVSEVAGTWEAYAIDIVDGNLVIAGSDKRGTIYGIYEISRLIGVSPWYWWADVPVRHQDRLTYAEGRTVQRSPKVKYRGIFINDEWPSFGGWSQNLFGGFNSKMYTRMFELLLRLKANYLWPAMWSGRFNEDDPDNPRLADEYGIVMGTSHHEPMMRAHKEYVVRRDSIGEWNYKKNKEKINRFFREGMERNKSYENLVTLGMRGDGDVAMGEGDDADNMVTLRDVIQNQRAIIKDIYGSEDAVPQVWALFSEVQRYYDAGFTVPDDVTLLFADNNWGYIRRTAPAEERDRKGGVGMYYHIDMNGGPWNDRWVNTSPIPKIREQLSLAYQSGIDRIWIVNVGDLKPKELPIDFIMTYAWDPEAIGAGDEKAYVRRFAASCFGEELADDAADILTKYPKYNLWRKAEVQRVGLFSVENYDEANRVTRLWQELEKKAEDLKARIPAEAQDAFFQLVYYPAVASAGVAELYLAATQNQYYAKRNDIRANAFADRAKELFARDSLLTEQYNHQLAGGKWNGMMQDKHIGYTRWFMPERNILPRLTYIPEPDSTTAQTITATRSESSEYAIAAHHFTRNIASDKAAWTFLPDLGRGEGCMGISPSATESTENADGPRLEYEIEVEQNGELTVAIGILPTHDVNPRRGLRLCAVLDNGEKHILDARRGLVDTESEYTPAHLRLSKSLKPLPAPSRLTLSGAGMPMRSDVFDNLRWLDVSFSRVAAGKHTLKICMIDPEIVLERLVINPDNDRYSYFGPNEKAVEQDSCLK